VLSGVGNRKNEWTLEAERYLLAIGEPAGQGVHQLRWLGPTDSGSSGFDERGAEVAGVWLVGLD
jgi:hypothetical protein